MQAHESASILLGLYQEEMTAARGYCERRVHYVPALFMVFAAVTAATAALVGSDIFKGSMVAKATIFGVGAIMYFFVYSFARNVTRMMAALRKLIKRHYKVALGLSQAIREIDPCVPPVIDYPRSHLPVGEPYVQRSTTRHIVADVRAAAHPDYRDRISNDAEKLAKKYWSEQNCPDTHVYEVASAIKHLAAVAASSLGLLAIFCILHGFTASSSGAALTSSIFAATVTVLAAIGTAKHANFRKLPWFRLAPAALGRWAYYCYWHGASTTMLREIWTSVPQRRRKRRIRSRLTISLWRPQFASWVCFYSGIDFAAKQDMHTYAPFWPTMPIWLRTSDYHKDRRKTWLSYSSGWPKGNRFHDIIRTT